MEASRKRFIGALWENAAGGRGRKEEKQGAPTLLAGSGAKAPTQPASSRPQKSIKSRGGAQQRGAHIRQAGGNLLHSPNRSCYRSPVPAAAHQLLLPRARRARPS
jgi:hypothetical protein